MFSNLLTPSGDLSVYKSLKSPVCLAISSATVYASFFLVFTIKLLIKKANSFSFF
jgi:hypothetical protein